jgi:hypothetical protein
VEEDLKVKELIEKLWKLDQEIDVLCYTEDSAFLPPGHGFRHLEIEDVNESEGQRVMAKDDIPSMKFEHGSPKHAFINVTSGS